MLIITAQSINAQKDFKFVAPFPSRPHDVRTFTVIDTAKYVINNSVKVINNPVKYPKDTLDEVLTLQIGNRLSRSFNQTTFDADSILFYHYIAKGTDGPYHTNSLVPVDVYKNYPQGTTTVEYRLTKYNYRYKETFPIQLNWQLSNERKRILSYNCQKATCAFRGRNYTAWFTSEIPIPNGPYKFEGLPGLILQISDDKNHYVFSCIGIQKPKSIVPIKLFTWKYTDITREKLNLSLIKVYNNQAQFMVGSGWRTRAMDENGKFTDVTAKLPNLYSYNPIELE
jgi:GLPGLI family protein